MKFNLLVFAGMALAGPILPRVNNSDAGIEAAETDDRAIPKEWLETQKEWESSEWVKQQKEIFVPPPRGDLRSLFKYLITKDKQKLAKQTENLVLPSKPDLRALFKYEATKHAQEYLEREGVSDADGPRYADERNRSQMESDALN
ncbi:hypothetical protein FAGAP_8876 [Fusarium agapanthi]|uniref:Uncharacterized protein n=1 Tax=Fusarium agapanthi TaxID=1803897 RepID=A0A9P5E4V9_9HYPO|nr:hypothetical protein FAGAP_8876 [Fusarium agapanthi]